VGVEAAEKNGDRKRRLGWGAKPEDKKETVEV
jgi:hypothetical protein